MSQKTIGILETGKVASPLFERHGPYDAMFRRMFRDVAPDLDFRTYAVVEHVLPGSPEECDAWLVTGSRHGVYDALPWMAPLKAFLRACIEAERRIVGICFGHQILAEALGGRVEKSTRGWGAGVHRYEALETAERAGFPLKGALALYAMHQDQIVETPPDATVLAQSDFCPSAVLAYGPLEAPFALSVQPHPEFDADFVGDIARQRRGDAMPEPVADKALASLAEPVDSRPVAAWLADYLRGA